MAYTYLEKQKHGSVFLNPSSSWPRQLHFFTIVYLVFWLLLIQCHEAQSYSRITFCYNKNNYEGEKKAVVYLMTEFK